MEVQEIREIIFKELPAVMEKDPEIQKFILDLSKKHFAGKVETENRIDRLLDELKRDREASDRRWEESQRKFEILEKERKESWEALLKERKESWEANERRWQENQNHINRMIGAIEVMAKKHESSIGALGARWGIQTEEAFRNALKGLLENRFNVEVLHVNEFDDKGEVFGRPDQIELDLIITDGELLIGEIKSSMSKGDMYIFERKARFYEKRHQRNATRLFVISPMIDPKARVVAKNLAIEAYSYEGDFNLDGD